MGPNGTFDGGSWPGPLRRPRQWGACWLFCRLWKELRLDGFWGPLLPASRKGTQWLEVLKVLCANRLIAPSSEWRVHREWFARSAMRDLLGCGAEVSAKDTLYRIDRQALRQYRLARAATCCARTSWIAPLANSGSST